MKATIVLRIGLAFVFGYAVSAFLMGASDWSQYYPQWASNILPTDIFLIFFSIFEVILVIWLLSGKWVFAAAWIAAATIFLLTAVNLDLFNILFRNVAIFSAAVALILLSKD